MERSKLMELQDSLFKEAGRLLTSKGQDYAGEDALANFKRMCQLSSLLGIDVQRSPADCALFLMLLKIDRWMNLKSKGAKPENESVKDTVMDLLNYIELAYCCEIEVTE